MNTPLAMMTIAELDELVGADDDDELVEAAEEELSLRSYEATVLGERRWAAAQ